MPTAILPMESGSHWSHVHRHGRGHDARGSFSKLSERICDKGCKVVSRPVMPLAISLPMESGSHGSHVHRHGRSHDARGLFSKTSERICDKGFKVVSRPVSCQRRYCQWSLDLRTRMYTDIDRCISSQ